MNKKFFAALASATMAFTASGSIAVFADDFVEESNIVDNGDVKPVETEVVWNKDNFGALVTLPEENFVGYPAEGVDLVKNKSVKTADLEKITSINLKGFKGEVKGLEYFTGLTSFNDTDTTDNDSSNHKIAEEITNTTLDFSENKALTEIKVNQANGLTKIVLPNPTKTEDDLDQYVLKTVNLQNTQLKSVDLSAYNSLKYVAVANNDNLTEVTLPKRTSLQKDELALTGLNLSNNALETVNLDYYYIGTSLDLSGNHIGALDLSKTKVNSGVNLTGQTFYVSETLENVNLAETFENFDKEAVAESKTYSQKTGVLTLTTDPTEYQYDTKLKNGTTKLVVSLEKANPMNRLYNPNSGEHFYTADLKEKAALVNLGWNDEGYGWVAPQNKDGKPVYRLYNPNAGDHHYTTDPKEKATLVTYGWKDENVGWYSATNVAKEKRVPVFRQYNPFANGAGSHNYTTDKAENDYLVSLGWTPEGTAWFALQ